MTLNPTDRATRDAESRVALVACHMFPDLYSDDVLLQRALQERGARADAVRWDDPAADWAAYDLVVIRETWDYPARRDEFLAWAHRVPRLANPADVVEWNTDKRYLSDLAAAGVPVTPTTYVAPGEEWTAPPAGEWVVKPTISAASQDTGRYVLPGQADLAARHVDRLHAAGRTAMVQPYLAAVDTVGETAVLHTPDGSGELSFSHGVRKGPLLTGPDLGDKPGEYDEEIAPRQPSPAELALAEQALAAVPGGPERLLYARVDLFPGPDGAPVLAELELTEPSLFFGCAAGSADRLAEAILRRASSGSR